MTRLFSGTPWDRPPTCDRCAKPVAECNCPPPTPPKPSGDPSKQTARVRREKRQKGKLVTVVSGLSGSQTDLPQLLTQLKSSLGTGGTMDDESLVIQGDQVERVSAALAKLGYKVKG
ncbi:MAG: translation initiation factor [Planctomycetaceae bacterium]